MIADLYTAALILTGIAAVGLVALLVMWWADRKVKRIVARALDEPQPPVWVNHGGPRVVPPRRRRAGCTR